MAIFKTLKGTTLAVHFEASTLVEFWRSQVVKPCQGNVWDAFDYHATSGHNICGMSHNYQESVSWTLDLESLLEYLEVFGAPFIILSHSTHKKHCRMVGYLGLTDVLGLSITLHRKQ